MPNDKNHPVSWMVMPHLNRMLLPGDTLMVGGLPKLLLLPMDQGLVSDSLKIAHDDTDDQVSLVNSSVMPSPPSDPRS